MSASTLPAFRARAVAAWLLACALGACTQTHVVLEPADDLVVSTANLHTCAISSGALFCWGANADGQLGVGNTSDQLSPVRVGIDGDWAAVATNERATLALKRDGTLWSFGANDAGQLGLADGDFTPRQTPTRLGDRADWTAIASRFNHACALASDGSLWCWGAGDEGQLGQGEPLSVTPANRSIPIQITTDRDFVAVDAGQGHTCALRQNGTLWCWGRNSQSLLAQGPGAQDQIRNPVQVGSATDWQIVQSGQNSMCGVRGNVVYCWGRAIGTAIPGSPDMSVVDQPTAIGAPANPLAMSFNTFGGCVVDRQGGAACWGRNAEGQLGLGDMNSRTAVEKVPASGWTSVSAGRFSNCGVRSGQVVCAGDNRNGQLGQGDTNRTDVFVAVPLPPLP